MKPLDPAAFRSLFQRLYAEVPRGLEAERLVQAETRLGVKLPEPLVAFFVALSPRSATTASSAWV
ncbi:MAG: hypothetical protein AAGH15_24195 [Myxococcota bacterium]